MSYTNTAPISPAYEVTVQRVPETDAQARYEPEANWSRWQAIVERLHPISGRAIPQVALIVEAEQRSKVLAACRDAGFPLRGSTKLERYAPLTNA